MKLDGLARFLAGKISAEDFARSVQSEVDGYSKRKSVVGSSMPVVLEENIGKLRIDNESIRRIAEPYLKDVFSDSHVAYICDALLLCKAVEFASESCEEKLSLMTDPEVNGELTKERMLRLVESL